MPALDEVLETAADAASSSDWGPVASGRHRRIPRRLRAALLVIILLPLGFGASATAWSLSRISRVEVAGLGGGGPRNFLVVGSDSREGLSREERRELSTGSAPGHRTDTIFVLTVGGGRAAMLALPRDLLVTRCDGSQGRINGAEAIGGPTCLVDTVERTSGIGIDHYVAIDFGGFRSLVDAVGGVELCLPSPIQDDDAGIDLEAGCQVLDGPDALGYVRVRKIDNDLARIGRQQEFMQALAGRIASASTILNPFRLFSVAGAGGSAITTDRGFGPLDALALARGVRALQSGNVVTDTVPTEFANVNGAAVLRPTSAATALYESHANGSILGQATPRIDPSEVALQVRNGAGVAGLAATVATRFEHAGVTVTRIGNAQPTERTRLRFPPHLRLAAQLVASLAPTSVRLVEDDSAQTLDLVLGRDTKL